MALGPTVVFYLPLHLLLFFIVWAVNGTLVDPTTVARCTFAFYLLTSLACLPHLALAAFPGLAAQHIRLSLHPTPLSHFALLRIASHFLYDLKCLVCDRASLTRSPARWYFGVHVVSFAAHRLVLKMVYGRAIMSKTEFALDAAEALLRLAAYCVLNPYLPQLFDDKDDGRDEDTAYSGHEGVEGYEVPEREVHGSRE